MHDQDVYNISLSLGNDDIGSMSELKASLPILLEAYPDNVYQKSLEFTPYQMLTYNQSNDNITNYYLACKGITPLPLGFSFRRSIGMFIVELFDNGLASERTDKPLMFNQFLFDGIRQLYLPSIESQTALKIIGEYFNVPSVFMNLDVFATVFIRGYLQPLPVDEHLLKRYSTWQNLSEEQKVLITTFYREGVFPQDFVYETRPLTMESIIINQFPDEEKVIDEVGLILPNGTNLFRYLMANASLYECAVSKGNGRVEVELPYDIHLFNDKEIMEHVFKGRYSHASRVELTTEAVNFFNGVPTIFIPDDPSKSINKISPISLDKIDKNSDVISYGSRNGFFSILLNELSDHFRKNNKNAYSYGMYDPNGNYITLGSSQADLLRRTIELLADKNGYVEAINALNTIDSALRANDFKDKSIFETYHKFSLDTQFKIRDYLLAIFEMGMYMRQWKGPGFPYPLKKIQTGNEESFDHNKKLAVPIGKVYECFKLLGNGKKFATLSEAQKFVHELPQIDYRNGIVIHSENRTIGTVFDSITINDDFKNICLRMSSIEMVCSGHHYLAMFVGENVIPGFQPYDMDHII